MGVLSPSGVISPLTFDGEERAGIERVASILRQLPVPLPEEPVGVGAVWEVTETVELLGSRTIQTVRYQLTGREGNRLEIRISSAEAAPPEEILTLGAGSDVRLDGFHASTTGEATVDLTRPIPLQWTSRLRIGMTGRRDEEPLEIDVDLSVEVDTR
jgi:hypothetical protein